MRYRDYRYPCDLAVTVTRRGGGPQAAIIVNISTWGARLARLEGVEPGETLHLTLGAGCPVLTANVQWSRGLYTGVRFAAALEPRQIALARRSVNHRQRVNPSGWNLQLNELR